MYFNNVLLVSIFLTCCNAFVSNYVKEITNFFGFNSEESVESTADDIYNNKVIYEVSTVDEKFISEAAKLTGVVLSELDKCQQRIILKLKKGCNEMNDEDISKMAVMLLNCQSAIEGRRIYHCTNEMGIKDCTHSMDADTWNTYHLMTNRVRAVCYTARQSQFIGLTEHTINKLVDTTRNQVKTLDKIVIDQTDLQNLAEETLESVKQGHNVLSSQQKDLEKAQLYGQLLVENNLKRLADEKFLIAQTHRELSNMVKNLQNKLTDQSKESSANHKEILQDLLLIQSTTQDIFRRIEDSSILLIERSERALELSEHTHEQYLITLKQLSEVNKTVHSLANLVSGTGQILEDRLNWISSALGGTDITVDRLYLLTWHIVFIIVTMIASSFIDLRITSRIFAISLPCLNLAIGLNDLSMALNPGNLTICVITVLIVHSIACFLYKINKPDQISHQKLSIKNEELQTKQAAAVNATAEYTTSILEKTWSNVNAKENSKYDRNESNVNTSFYHSSHEDTFEDYCGPTPPLSRMGYNNSRSRSRTPSVTSNFSISKNSCAAKTRLGTPCKLSCIPGRDFCHRHMRGDSVKTWENN